MIFLEKKEEILKHAHKFIFDFKSLYPSLILTSNIGFDTLDENGKIINPGTGF